MVCALTSKIFHDNVGHNSNNCNKKGDGKQGNKDKVNDKDNDSNDNILFDSIPSINTNACAVSIPLLWFFLILRLDIIYKLV